MKIVKKKSTGRPRKYDLPGEKNVADKIRTNKVRREEARLSVVFPKPGELVDTSVALCSYCKYSCNMSGGTYTMCDYYLVTKNMRGCKQGECDKFDMGDTDKKKTMWPNFGKGTGRMYD